MPLNNILTTAQTDYQSRVGALAANKHPSVEQLAILFYLQALLENSDAAIATALGDQNDPAIPASTDGSLISHIRQISQSLANAKDREFITTHYRAKVAGTGYAAGDQIAIAEIVDATGATPIVLGELARNLTQATTLATIPPATDLEINAANNYQYTEGTTGEAVNLYGNLTLADRIIDGTLQALKLNKRTQLNVSAEPDTQTYPDINFPAGASHFTVSFQQTQLLAVILTNDSPDDLFLFVHDLATNPGTNTPALRVKLPGSGGSVKLGSDELGDYGMFANNGVTLQLSTTAHTITAYNVVNVEDFVGFARVGISNPYTAPAPA